MVAGAGEPRLSMEMEDFLRLAERYTTPIVVPLCISLPAPPHTPLEIYARLRGKRGFLLESMEGSERIARYSYIGPEPEITITFGDSLFVEGSAPFLSMLEGVQPDDVPGALRTILRSFSCARGAENETTGFFGGVVGYLSYDLIHALFDTVRRRRGEAPGTPLAQFMLVRDCVVIDHLSGRMQIYSSPILLPGSDPEEEYQQSMKRILALGRRIYSSHVRVECNREEPCSALHITTSMGREEFCQRTEEMKRRIHEGEIFQGVLSRRIDIWPAGSASSIYRALRRLNPSPYMYLLDFGEMQMVGASPEMLVRVEGDEITTVPIAGTRPRGRNQEEDERLANELLADEKELAEHAMLVDLARNDAGRVCRFGSVRVEDFMAIERFSHVQHIVSTVRGRLEEGFDGFDALRACFPAGTVTGAPKIRAMQIISELEPEGRGAYAGAVGYAGFNGNLEFAITIRTILLRGRHASVQVGAGIVADSIPEREWLETESKAAAMLNAIHEAGVLP